MNSSALIDRLESFGEVLPRVVAAVGDSDARWKPPGGAWSILEVVCHLVDEETDDFRPRLRLVLDDPSQPWPAIDPEGAAVHRRYNEQNLGERAARLAAERRESVRWLRSLVNPDWPRAYQHPKWGPISAGMLLTSWAAHDLLHLRQIAKRQYELACRDGAPFAANYAGQWTA